MHFAMTVPLSALPLSTHMCHCSVCRYTHGTPCIFHAELPRGTRLDFVAPSSLEASCTGYAWENPETGERAKSTRYFCSTCGCHMGDVGAAGGPDEGEWVVATSIFEPMTEEELKKQGLGEEAKGFLGMRWQQIKTHTFTDSAPGGLHEWLPRLAGGEDGQEGPPVKTWNPDPNDPEWAGGVAAVVPEPEVGRNGEDRLRAQCHCGGVSFTIPRPPFAIKVDEYFKPWASPGDDNKWQATLDLCDDCRLVDGTHVVGWTFVPRRFILPEIGPDLLLGTSKTYASSPGVLRSFCGCCGATVFFTDFNQRQQTENRQVVDLSTGILRAPGGAMARDWLTWRTGKMSWFQSGVRYEKGFAEGLADGMKRWADEHDGGVKEWTIP